MAVSPESAITWWAVVSAFGGSLIGAAIGATVSFIVQRQALNAAKAQRAEDRLEVRKALGYSLLFKIIRVASNLHNIGKALRGSLTQAEKEGFKGQRWQIVQPIAPSGEQIHFTSDEMALVLSLDDKVFNEIAALDQLHNNTAAIFDLYGEQRTKVLDRFGAVMSGLMATTNLSKEEYEWLAPRGAALDGLIDVMLERSERDGQEAWDGLAKLNGVLENKLGIKHRLERKDAPPKKEALPKEEYFPAPRRFGWWSKHPSES